MGQCSRCGSEIVGFPGVSLGCEVCRDPGFDINKYKTAQELDTLKSRKEAISALRLKKNKRYRLVTLDFDGNKNPSQEWITVVFDGLNFVDSDGMTWSEWIDQKHEEDIIPITSNDNYNQGCTCQVSQHPPCSFCTDMCEEEVDIYDEFGQDGVINFRDGNDPRHDKVIDNLTGRVIRF